MWGLAAAGIAWHCTDVAQKITYITLADGRRKERKLPLLFRLLLPLTPNLKPVFNRPSFAKIRAAAARRITAAGFDGLISNEEFLALRLLLPCTFGVLWILAAVCAIPPGRKPFLRAIAVFLYMTGPLWLYAYPAVWLKKALTMRHKSIQRSLPFVLDLLTLSVEAGMDFMTALQRNVERRMVDPLNEELIKVIREIQLGKTRREALRNMSDRVNMSELRSVTNALIQADELGVSIGAMLRIQSGQIRQRRFERAEKLANEAPVKMLFPLLFFIFPAVILILLAPIVAMIRQHGL